MRKNKYTSDTSREQFEIIKPMLEIVGKKTKSRIVDFYEDDKKYIFCDKRSHKFSSSNNSRDSSITLNKIMRFFSFAITLLFMHAFVNPAHAFEISESLIEKYVQMKIQKSIAGVQISSAKIKLLYADAKLCAVARPKFFLKDIQFCAMLTPKWRQETASLLGFNIKLDSLDATGLSEKHVENTKRIINQTILPALEGIEIYKEDNFIGRRVSDIKIKPGKIDLVF